MKGIPKENMDIATIVIIGTILVGGFLLAMRLSIWMARRATCQVVNRFRAWAATTPQSARTMKELGISPPALISFRLIRDYKPWAFQALIRAEIVRTTPIEGMYYLAEQQLEHAPGITCADDGKSKLPLKFD